MASKTIIGLLPVLLASSVLAQDQSQDDIYAELDRFGRVFEQVQRDYVEDVDQKALIEAAIDGMLQSLDPHSSYLGADDFEELQNDTSGSFGGLGIQVSQEDGVIKVISPIDDTPAAEAGIQSGDFITHVNGESLLGLSIDEAIDLMRGPIGTNAKITIFREGLDEPFDVDITRDEIKTQSARVEAFDDVIYARLTQFNAQTLPNMVDGINEAIDELGGIDNVEGFIIDLRNNPGGLLTSAIDISDAFLDQGEIVSTRGRNPEDTSRAVAEKGDLAEGKPIVVLINAGSASASEIVAGALKDHQRAIVVGVPTFGKGSVQTILPLGEQSAIRLTTSRYYTPSGRSIQGLGIDPDVYVEQQAPKPVDEDDEERSQAFDRVGEGDLPGALSNDSLTDEEIGQREIEREAQAEAEKLRDQDFQLGYAIDILHGLSVYQDDE